MTRGRDVRAGAWAGSSSSKPNGGDGSAGAGVLSLGAADDVAPLSVVHDGRGQAHVRFQQEHQGLPVFMGQAIAHVDIATSKLATITDARMAVSDVDVDPTVRIEDAMIVDAGMDGSIARVTVRFRSDIAAVTRDAEGTVVAGSLDDAIEAVDVWTFARNVNSADPDWVLEETDEG